MNIEKHLDIHPTPTSCVIWVNPTSSCEVRYTGRSHGCCCDDDADAKICQTHASFHDLCCRAADHHHRIHCSCQHPCLQWPWPSSMRCPPADPAQRARHPRLWRHNHPCVHTHHRGRGCGCGHGPRLAHVSKMAVGCLPTFAGFHRPACSNFSLLYKLLPSCP